MEFAVIGRLRGLRVTVWWADGQIVDPTALWVNAAVDETVRLGLPVRMADPAEVIPDLSYPIGALAAIVSTLDEVIDTIDAPTFDTPAGAVN